ncbi:hypothetical protein D4764_15G0004910 [Takifugu flavidus]|uniref:C2H2-type domain-containing protein n=1 Tax=Takifugu flavidus TaxID=433684 RepID=A0A5C6P4P5_9TELE|nr:hypothetical protein D4764_15G0004910 [Takifugu flavidus]
MSPVAAFHAQLASIMEVLANTAVAEICELVDSGYSELQLEIARSRRENEQLRRKLRLMELRAARASALRALAGGGGGGGARAPVPGHHGDHARRARAQRGNIRVTLVCVEIKCTQTNAWDGGQDLVGGDRTLGGGRGPGWGTGPWVGDGTLGGRQTLGGGRGPGTGDRTLGGGRDPGTGDGTLGGGQDPGWGTGPWDGGRDPGWCPHQFQYQLGADGSQLIVLLDPPETLSPPLASLPRMHFSVNNNSRSLFLSLMTSLPPGEAAAASSAAAQERGSGAPGGLWTRQGKKMEEATPTAEAVAPTIKIEDGGASWSPSELNQEFCSVVAEETEAPPTSIKQEVSEESDGSRCASWMCDVTSSCWSIQQTPNTDSVTTQNPLREEPGHSLALNATVGVSSDSGGGGLSLKEAVAERQQGAPLPPDRPQLRARKAAADRPNASHRRERGRHQDGAGRGSGPGRGAGSSRAFVCNCCGKTLASLKNLNTHMRVHTGEKPFVCALCGKRFSDPSNLKRHQSVHTGEKRYGCVHCGKRFAQSGSLKVHMSVHTDCKQFRCSSCGKTFISGSHLRRHAAMHAAVHATERERPPPFSDH